MMKRWSHGWRLGFSLAFSLSLFLPPQGMCSAAFGASDSADESSSTVVSVLKASFGQGELKLTASNQGTKVYTATSDCTVTIKSYLITEGKSELSVQLNGEEIISWSRQNHNDSAKLKVRGEDVQESNVEGNPGDFTPKPQMTKIPLKKGDKLTLHLSGDFGKYEGYLSLAAPGISETQSASTSKASTDTKSSTGDSSAKETAGSDGFSHQQTFSSTGVAQAHRGGGTTFRIKKTGPSFGKRIKFVFADGWSVIVPDTSKRFATGNFVFRPGGGSNSSNTWTSHGGIFLCSNTGNTSKTVTVFY